MLKGASVTACLLENEPASYIFVARLRQRQPEPKGNRVRTERESQGVDTKPGELPMVRLKRG